MSKIIIAAGVVGVVILIECGMAFMLIPSTADLEAQVKATNAAPADSPAAETPSGSGETKPTSSTEPEAEQDLGKFNVVVHQPATNVTLRINFQLVAAVLAKDTSEITTLLENNKHRLRDQVIYEIRNSDVNDLTDPGLGLIKRKILAKSNELLGKPLFKAIYFSEFSFIEQ